MYRISGRSPISTMHGTTPVYRKLTPHLEERPALEFSGVRHLARSGFVARETRSPPRVAPCSRVLRSRPSLPLLGVLRFITMYGIVLFRPSVYGKLTPLLEERRALEFPGVRHCETDTFVETHSPPRGALRSRVLRSRSSTRPPCRPGGYLKEPVLGSAPLRHGKEKVAPPGNGTDTSAVPSLSPSWTRRARKSGPSPGLTQTIG